MSEVTDQGQIETAFFNRAESMYMDPMIAEVLSDIATYNKLLASEPVTGEVMNEIIADIDGEWKHLLQAPIVFAGNATFSNVQIEEGGLATGYFDDEPMLFLGAIPVENTDARGGGLATEDEEAFFSISVGLRREAIDYKGDRVLSDGIASTSDIVRLEFQHGMSTERARGILEQQQADLIDDIDLAILDDVEEESERVRGLGGLECKLTGDEESDRLVANALTVYVNSALRFDTHNGYGLTFEGIVWLGENGTIAKGGLMEFDALAVINRVVWVSPVGDESRLIPHIEIRACLEDIQEDEEMFHAVVPIEYITHLRSLRYAFYAGVSAEPTDDYEEYESEEEGDNVAGEYDEGAI